MNSATGVPVQCMLCCRYLEDGNDVCVGLLDGTIKVVNPAASQVSTALYTYFTVQHMVQIIIEQYNKENTYSVS
jgi:hypothetical protein